MTHFNLFKGNKVFPGMLLRLREVETKSSTIFSGVEYLFEKAAKPLIPRNISPITAATTKKEGSNELKLRGNSSAIKNEGKGVMSSSPNSLAFNFTTIFSNLNLTNNKASNGKSEVSQDKQVESSDDELEPAPREIWEIEIPSLVGENISILTNDFAKQLRPKLPRILHIDSMVLLYSLTQNGSDFTTFYLNMKNTEYAVVLIETISGEIIGGFASSTWKVSSTYYGTGESFIFKIDKESNTIYSYQWTSANNFFMYSTEHQIGMGGGGDGFGFILDTDFRNVSSKCCATYGNPCLLSTEEPIFVKNIEAFGFSSYIQRRKVKFGSPRSGSVI